MEAAALSQLSRLRKRRQRCREFRRARQAGGRFLDVAREIRAIYRRRRESNGAPGRDARLVASQHRPTAESARKIRNALEENRRQSLVDSAASGLSFDWFGLVARSLGTRHESALETRPELLYRTDAHRAGGSAHGPRAI